MIESHSLEKLTILVVDDTPDNLTLLSGLLRDFYKVKVANNGEKALRIAQSDVSPDLILLDVMMPEMDGYEVCQQLKANDKTKHIPIIFVTAKSETEDETKGFTLGAVDYITKPISPSVALMRIKTQLSMKKMQDFLVNQNNFLEEEVRKRTKEVIAIQDVTIHALASLAETRDTETGNHIRRTQHYVKVLAEKLRHHPRFAHFLNVDNNIDLLFKTAPLHDIGKVGIPDAILLKPGKFTAEEYEIMKAHPTFGYNTLQKAESELGISVPFIKIAKEIAFSHHEKWDGTGYPQGLVGEGIPIAARLMALADVYDALISRRVYKEGFDEAQVLEIIQEGKGKHFDPDVVDAFLELKDEFKEIVDIFK